MRWPLARVGEKEGAAWAPPTALDTPAVLRELEHFRLFHLMRLRRLRGGEFAGRSRGESNEFREYRPYVPGDDFRLIDWGLYIRLDRVYVKTFLDEEYRHVHILLDTSRSMASPDRKKFALARDLALALAHLALLNDDRVVLGLLPGEGRQKRGGQDGCDGRRRSGEECASLAPVRGPRSLHRLRSVLGRIRPGGAFHSPGAFLAHTGRQGRRQGLAVIISDFLAPSAELAAGLDVLARRRFAVCAIQVRDPRDESFPSEGSMVRAIDQETGRTRLVTVDAANRRRHEEAVARHKANLEAACARLGTPLVRYRTDGNPEEFLLDALPRMGLLRAKRMG